MGANIVKLWTNYWHIYLIEGVLNTLKLTCFAVVLGTFLGIFVAMAKMSKSKIVRFLITLYIEIIRGTPLLLQLYIFYFVLPTVLPVFDFSPFTWVAISLCINSSAYVSEIFRSGIQSVDKGQTEAARSLGLTQTQTMTKIVMPQAIKNILPALGNEFIMMIKETSLASTFFIGDLMTAHLKIKGATYLMMESLIITGIIYLVMTYPLSKLVEAVERKMKNAD
ncbi:MAG: amino acid ABC transporter permease [Oscillospiraceae bacterium]|nr:amino acid ABC transporter permease [Oscillospiraceae bacterium]